MNVSVVWVNGRLDSNGDWCLLLKMHKMYLNRSLGENFQFVKSHMVL